MPISLSLRQLLFTIFPVYDESLYEARRAYTHYTSEHSCALARQVISEDLAKAILAECAHDENLASLIHIQRYELEGTKPFFVLWMRDEWNTSTEKRLFHIRERLKRVEVSESQDRIQGWLQNLARSFHANIGIELSHAAAKIQLQWKTHGDVNKLLAWTMSLEEAFDCKLWVQPPVDLTNTTQQTQTQNEPQNQTPSRREEIDQADQSPEQEVGGADPEDGRAG